jgi:hypothetical protein
MPLEEDMMKERGCQKYRCMYNDKKDFEREKKVNFRRKVYMCKLSIKDADEQTFDQRCRCANFRSKM